MEKTIVLQTLVFGLISIGLWSCNGITRPTDIVLENNGYKKILVAIHPSIQEDADLITNIKDLFKNASSYLYQATYKRAYFREITILVPSSWSNNFPASSQIYDNADIEFTSRSPRHRRQPHSRSFSGCGSPGIRIHLTPDVFNTSESMVSSIDILGPRGRFLVHEWGHFRWGVYDEYAEDGEQQFYFSPTTGKIEAVACNMNMRGIRYRIENGKIEFCRQTDTNTGRYADGCTFLAYNRGHYTTVISSSIMHRPYVAGIKYFCDNESSSSKKGHNTEAPSKQNRMCGQRSTWSVILESQDFKDNNNPPRDISDTTPTFTVVKAAATRRVALVFDTSGSMVKNDVLGRLTQAAANYIHNGIGTNSQLGIVSFNSKAKLLHPMTTIKTQSDRERLKRSLPRTTGGSTSIGAGVDKAIELLSSNGQNTTGAEIVVLTDGTETSQPDIDDALPKVKASGTIVTVLALNQQSKETLSDAAHTSGGRFYFDNNQDASTALSDALFKMRQDPTMNTRDSTIQLLSKSAKVRNGNKLSGRFSMDADVGRNTVFTVMYQKEEPTITITSPTVRVFNHRYPEYKDDHNYNTIRIEIPEIAETGTWTYNVRNNHIDLQKISIMITTEPVDDRREPVTIDAATSSVSISPYDKLVIWADVTKGSHPVTEMKVTAIIDRPFADPVNIELLDNGAGADVTKQDGVYSRYFTKFSGFGRYSIKIEVEDKADQSTVRKSIIKVLDSPFIDKVSGLIVGDKREVSLQPLMMSVSRSTTAGSFHYKSLNISSSSAPEDLEADMLAPVRITDLAVMKTSHQDQTVMLSWTAPGDDMDSDTATRYDIVMSHNTEDMILGQKSMRFMSQEEIIHGNLMAPKEAGIQEMFIIKVPFSPGTKTSFVFSVRAVDEKGNMGDKSNYATAGFGYVPDFINKEYRPFVTSHVTDGALLSSSHITILVGIVGSLSVAICFTIILTLCLHRFAGDKSNTTIQQSKSNIV